MQITDLQFRLERLGVSSRILHLRVGAMDVGIALNQAAAKVRKKRDVPGFRKGKAPLKRVLGAHYREVTSKAFNELWNTAMRQVLRQLEDVDQPLIPPELEGDENRWPRPAYDEMLEFSVSYIVDPVKIADAMDPAKQDAGIFSGGTPNLPYHGAPRMPGPAGPPDMATHGMPAIQMPSEPQGGGE